MMNKPEAIAPDVPDRIVIVGGGFAGVTLGQRRMIAASAHGNCRPECGKSSNPHSYTRRSGRKNLLSPSCRPGWRQFTLRTRWLGARGTQSDRERNEAHNDRPDGTKASMG